jgi:pimeloyl-ACP methyl ester carboxylesterase
MSLRQPSMAVNEPSESIPPWPGRLVAVGERKIFVRHAGDGGDPMVCVHGLEGSATNWTELMAELVGEYSMDAPDLPGFGLSPPPASSAGYSITGQAEAVAATIERLHDGPVHLVGNSLGGAVSIRVAARRPELVRTVTLVSPVLPDKWPHWELTRFPLMCVPGVGGWLLRRVAEVRPEVRARAVAAFVFCDPSAINPARLEAEAAEYARRDGLGYAGRATVASVRSLVAEVFREALWRDAARVRAPALVIFGSHDKLVDPRLAGRAARTFRDSRVLVLPRSGHVSHMEHPAKVASEIREWTRRVPG